MNRPVSCTLCHKPIKPGPRAIVYRQPRGQNVMGTRLAHFHTSCWETLDDVLWTLHQPAKETA